MIDNSTEEPNQKSRDKTRRPETNGTTDRTTTKPESPRETNCTSIQNVPISFVEQVRTEDTNCFGNERSTTCTSLRIWDLG